MLKATSLVGLDVHARQTHAAVFVPDTGEMNVSKLRMEPVDGWDSWKAWPPGCWLFMRPDQPGSL
jgi:hypothetical protein